jgi:hypothetical protein
MPVTRRRRATSPEQPENTNTAAQSPEQAAGSPAEASTAELASTEHEPTEQSSLGNSATEFTSTEVPVAPLAKEVSSPAAAQETPLSTTETSAQSSSESVSHFENGVRSTEEDESTPFERSEQAPTPHLRRSAAARAAAESLPYQPLLPSGPTNGDRQEYIPNIEGGRRTARGELFRRPPQPPTVPYTPPVSQPPQLQAPTHEISLPLGNELHLAYNPGYTGSDDARNSLLHKLQEESKSGGRARCWSCGSLAIVYDRWNTRSKTFGEIGIAYCEICGVWSVM